MKFTLSLSQRYHCQPMTTSVSFRMMEYRATPYGHYAIPSCVKQDVDIGASVNADNLGASVDDDDAWLYIPYDN